MNFSTTACMTHMYIIFVLTNEEIDVQRSFIILIFWIWFLPRVFIFFTSWTNHTEVNEYGRDYSRSIFIVRSWCIARDDLVYVYSHKCCFLKVTTKQAVVTEISHGYHISMLDFFRQTIWRYETLNTDIFLFCIFVESWSLSYIGFESFQNFIFVVQMN